MSNDKDRSEFEAATWAYYQGLKAKGWKHPAEGDSGDPESLFWREASGRYGVHQIEAAWQGWRMKCDAIQCAAEAHGSERDAQEQPFEDWWEREGQFGRAGGGQYEKTFAWNAWCAASKAQPKGMPAGWQEAAPTAPGIWLMSCRETNEVERVTVERQRGELWAVDTPVGSLPVRMYHDGLTNAIWAAAVPAQAPAPVAETRHPLTSELVAAALLLKRWAEERNEPLGWHIAGIGAVSAQAPAVKAEPLGYLSEHTGPDGPFKWQFSKTLAGVYRDTALRIIPVYEPPVQGSGS